MIKRPRCKTHPNYKGKDKPPKNNCESCWLSWLFIENMRLKEQLAEIREEVCHKADYIDPIYGDDW